MLRISVILVLLAGFGIEMSILESIFDPHGVWHASTYADLTFYGPVSAFPYAVVLGWTVLSRTDKNQLQFLLRCASSVAILGVAISFIAMRQGGHASGGLLPIGYFLQWLAVGLSLMFAWRRRRVNK